MKSREPVTTLSFHKVMFDAQEVLDFLDAQLDYLSERDVEAKAAIERAIERFLNMAESRSRINRPDEPPPTAAVPAKPK